MKHALRMVGAIAWWSVVVSVLWVLLLRFIPPPVTWVMVEQATEQDGIQRDWRPLDKIAPAMPLAVIAAEDQRFFAHRGFDIEAIQKAIGHNGRSKRKRGASTISQQTAKNVFLWPGRNFLRKGLEAWFTLLTEALWGKERIIEVYLNVAETGKGRFGVGAAARHCFGRGTADLSVAQAALIAAVLPAPRRFSACLPSAYVRKRQAWIQRQMQQLGNLMDPAERGRLMKLRRDREKRGRR